MCLKLGDVFFLPFMVMMNQWVATIVRGENDDEPMDGNGGILFSDRAKCDQMVFHPTKPSRYL